MKTTKKLFEEITALDEKFKNNLIVDFAEDEDVKNGKKTLEEAIRDAFTEIVEKCEEYNEVSRIECYTKLAKAEDPLFAAIEKLTFKVYKYKEIVKKVEEVEVTTYKLIEGDQFIELKQFANFCKRPEINKTIGKDENWLPMIEKFNCLLTAKAGKALGVKDLKKIEDSYAMSELARQIDMGKTPTSNTQMLKALQAIVTAMIGEEYKVSSHDVAFLNYAWGGKSRKALTVQASNHKQLRRSIMEICHKVAFDKSYELDYKAKK